MAVTVGELIVELDLDASGLSQGLEGVYERGLQFTDDFESVLQGIGQHSAFDGLHLSPTVDLTQIHDLNKAFDRKIQHAGEVQTYLDRNPLTPKVDLCEVEKLQRTLDGLQGFSIGKIGVRGGDGSGGGFKLLAEKIDTLTASVKAVEATSIVNKSELKIELSKGKDGGLLGAPFKLLLGGIDDIFTGFNEQIGATLGGEFGAGFGKELQSALGFSFRGAGKQRARAIVGTGNLLARGAGNALGIDTGAQGEELKRVLGAAQQGVKGILPDTQEISRVGDEIAEIIGSRLRKGSFKIGDGVVAAFGESQTQDQLNAFIREGFDIPGLRDELGSMVRDLQRVDFNIFPERQTEGLPLQGRIVDSLLRSRRMEGIRTRALPLVRERTQEILESRRTKNTGKVVDESTRELIIATGGFANARGLSGARIAKDLAKEVGDEIKVIFTKNPDTDLSSIEAARTRKQALAMSLAKPNLRGFSEDAVEMAAQAMAALELNPEVQIKFLGESGGGFVAEEANEILRQLGKGEQTDFLGVGTPDFAGRLDQSGRRKILSPDEPLGRDINEMITPMGLTFNDQRSQQVLGVEGHVFEFYRQAQLPELMNFLFGEPERMTEEMVDEIRAFAAEMKTVEPADLGEGQRVEIAKEAIQQANDVMRQALSSTGDRAEEMRSLSMELEEVFTRFTPDSGDFQKVRSKVNSLRSQVQELEDNPGIESSNLAQERLEEVQRLNKLFGRLFKNTGGTDRRKFQELSQEFSILEERLSGFDAPGASSVAMPTMQETVMEMAMEPIDLIDSPLGEYERIGEVIGQSAIRAMAEGAPQVFGGEQGFNQELLGKIGNFRETAERARNLLSARPEDSQSQLSIAQELLPNLMAEIDDVIQSIPTGERMAGMGSQAANAKSQLSKIDSQIKGLFKNLVGRGEGQEQSPDLSIQSLNQEIESLGQEFFDQVKSAQRLAGSMEPNDRERAQQIARELLEFQQQYRDTLQELQDIVGQVEGGAPRSTRKALSTARGRLTRGGKSAQSVVDETEGLGVNAGAAFNQGLQSTLNAAQSTARELAQMTVEEIKNILDIRSPSRVGIWLGEMFGKGYQMGLEGIAGIPSLIDNIQDQVPTVEKAGNKLGEDLARGLISSFDSGVSALGKGLGLEPEKATRTENELQTALANTGLDNNTGSVLLNIASNVGANSEMTDMDAMRRVFGEISSNSEAILSVVAGLATDFRDDPSKALLDGIRRQETALKAFAQSRGRETMSLGEVISESTKDRLANDVKEATVLGFKASLVTAGKIALVSAKKTISEIFEEIKRRFLGLLSSVNPFGESRAKGTEAISLGELIESQAGSGEDIGLNLASSLAGGVLKGGQLVADSAFTLGKEFIGSIKSFFQIASPSKLMEDIGLFVAQGWVSGVEKVRGLFDADVFKSTVEEIKESTGEVFDAGGDLVGNLKDDLMGLIKGPLDQIPGSIKQIGGSIIGLLAGLKIFDFVQDNLGEFLNSSIDAAINFQRVESSLQFITGSAKEASEQIKTIRDEANLLGADASQSLEGFTQLAGATRGTSLSGVATEQIADAIEQTSVVSNLTQEQIDRATIGFSQIAGKGVLSTEELQGQIAEVGGVFSNIRGITARALGFSQEELSEALRRGEILAEDALPKIAQQLSAETASGVAGASKLAQASINRFNNSLTELQESAGKELLPARQLGLELAADLMGVLVDVAPVAIQLLGSVAAKLGFDVTVSAVKASGAIGALNAQLALLKAGGIGGLVTGLKGAAVAAGTLGKSLAAAAAPFAVIFGLIETAKILKNNLGDLSGEVGDFADTAQEKLDAYRATVERVTAANQGLADSFRINMDPDTMFTGSFVENILGRDLSRELEGGINNVLRVSGVDALGRLMGRDGTRSFAERQADDQSIARAEAFRAINESISESFGPEIMGAIAESNTIDVQVAELQARRRNTRDTDERQTLDREIDELFRQRESSASIVGSLQGTLATQQQGAQQEVDNLRAAVVRGGVNDEVAKRLNQELVQAESVLEGVTERQNALTAAIDTTVDRTGLWLRELRMIDAVARDLTLDEQLTSARERLDVALQSGEMGAGAIAQAEGQLTINTLERQLAISRQSIENLSETINTDLVQDAFQKLEIDPNIAPEQLLEDLAQQSEGRNNIPIEIERLTEFAQRSSELKQLEIESLTFESDLATARTDLQQQARDLSLGYRDLSETISGFYRANFEGAEDVANQIASQDLQNATQDIATEIRKELIGLEDSFVAGLGDSFTSLVESLREPLLNELGAIQQRNDITRTLQDQLRGARDLQRQASEFDFNAGLGPDPRAGLPTPQMLSNTVMDESGRVAPRVINLTPEQSFMGGFLGEAPLNRDPANLNPTPFLTSPEILVPKGDIAPSTTLPILADGMADGSFGNAQIAAASDLARRAADEQLASIDRNLATQANTASVEAESAIAAITRQLEEGRRSIAEQSDNFGRTLRDIGQEIGNANPLRELESSLLGVSDRFTDTNQELEDFQTSLLDTIQETQTVRSQLLANIEAGTIGKEALQILPDLDRTIADSQTALARADSQIQQNRELLEAQRAEIIRDFQDAEEERRRAAQERIVTGRDELRVLQFESSDDPFDLQRQRAEEINKLIAEADSRANQIGFSFAREIDELQDLVQAGELTKLEFSALQDNLIDLSEVELTNLTQQFDQLVPTVDDLATALGQVKGELDSGAFDRISENISTSIQSGAFTGEQAREAREGLSQARRISGFSDEGIIRELINTDNTFTSDFLEQAGRGDLVALADIGIQNRQAAEAERQLANITTDPEALASRLTEPELARPNVNFSDFGERFSQDTGQLVTALKDLNETIKASGTGSNGVVIQQQNVSVPRNEEDAVAAAAKAFNEWLAAPI